MFDDGSKHIGEKTGKNERQEDFIEENKDTDEGSKDKKSDGESSPFLN